MNQKEKVLFLRFLLIVLLVCFLVLLAMFIIAYAVTSLSEPDILNDQSKQTLKRLDESDSEKAKKIFNKFNSNVANQLIELLSTAKNIKKFLDVIDENNDKQFFENLNLTMNALFKKDKDNISKINLENQKAFLLNLTKNNIKFFSKLKVQIYDINEIFETPENIQGFLQNINSKEKENCLIKLLESFKLVEFIKTIVNFGQSDKGNKNNFENLKVFLQKINSDNVDLMVNLINIDFFRKLNYKDFNKRNILNKNSEDLLANILDVINKDNSEFLSSYINDKNILKRLFIDVNFPDFISFLNFINQNNKDVFLDFFRNDFLGYLYRLVSEEQNIYNQKISHHLEKMAQNIEKNKDVFQNAMDALKAFRDNKKNQQHKDFGKLLIFILTSDDIEKYADLNQEKIIDIFNSEKYRNYDPKPIFYSQDPVSTTTDLSFFNPIYEKDIQSNASDSKQ